MKRTLDIAIVVKEIYDSINADIGCLQDNLSAKEPGAASRKWHNNAWDADQYAQFACSCVAIDTLLGLLKDLKIHKKYRDAKFEREAANWAGIY